MEEIYSKQEIEKWHFAWKLCIYLSGPFTHHKARGLLAQKV
jgi:hypothetical protein